MKDHEHSPQIRSIIREITDTIQHEGSVRAVFGSPMELDSHSVIPVAAVTIRVGGGVGSARGPAQDSLRAKLRGTGFGGGGGMDIEAKPLGFISEQDGVVAFHPIDGEGAGDSAARTVIAKIIEMIAARTPAPPH